MSAPAGPPAVSDDPPFPDADERLVVEPDCARCPALVDCRNRICWGVGPREADVVVVGEAPGPGSPEAARWRGGDHTGMAYTARHSGRRIRETMRRAGVSRAYYTNAVKCLPCDGDGGTREPTPTERERCREHLLAELDAVDPAVLVTTGRHAMQSALAAVDRELDGFVERVLDPVELDPLGVTLVPLVHPSYRDVWIARLGYDYPAYAEAVGERIAAVRG
ncbi:uracil-DNA glycosylase [Halobacteriales archaeon SW_12_71_31]|nr:MAG: uracil-DNA glycosylase [Halobacteriales archaeon SW_12_71_31]